MQPSCGVLSPFPVESGVATVLWTLLISAILLISLGFCSYFAFLGHTLLKKPKRRKQIKKLQKQLDETRRIVLSDARSFQSQITELTAEQSGLYDANRMVISRMDQSDENMNRYVTALGNLIERRRLENVQTSNVLMSLLDQDVNVSIDVGLSERRKKPKKSKGKGRLDE